MIGYNFLKSYEVKVDFHENQITLVDVNIFGRPKHKSSQPKPDYTLDFQLSNHLPLLKAEVNNEKLWLGIDTGASQHVFQRGLKEKLKESFVSKYLVKIASLKNKSETRNAAVLDEIIIDRKFSLAGGPVIFSNLDHINYNLPYHMDGLLGLSFFKNKTVVLNYKRRKIHIWDKSKRLTAMK